MKCNPSLSNLVALSALALYLAGCGGGGGGDSSSGTDAGASARLASLVTSVGQLSPAFDPEITDYTVWMGAGTSSVVLTPTPVEAGASVAVDGGPLGVPVAVTGFGVAADIEVTSPDGSTTLTYTVDLLRVPARDLIDPTPREGDRFGHSVAVLRSGIVVVTDPYDWTGALQAGAVHLYNPFAPATPFATVNGSSAAELLGLHGITVLANDNFVVRSPGGVNNVGTVRLIDGLVGTQIGPTLMGTLPDDFNAGGITALANGNYVVSTSSEDVGGLVDAGAVRLFSGTTGTQIGVALVGNVASDRMGSDGIVALANSNYVVQTPRDSENGVSRVGSARLMSGSTGAPVGPGVVGQLTDDLCTTEIEPLANGNFVLAASYEDAGGIEDAGTVRLFNATTGAQVGTTLSGDTQEDGVGSRGVTALGNGNYVVSSQEDDVGGVLDAGSVRLMSGATGAQIGPTLAGETAGDRMGSGRAFDVGNGNFVVASPNDDEGGIADAGSVRLVSGTTGLQIGAALTGDDVADGLGSARVVVLGNGNFVVRSAGDDVGGVVDAGSLRLVDGTTGLQIGPILAGDGPAALLGRSGTIALANGNYVVTSEDDADGGLDRGGSIRLFSGTLGTQIGPTQVGDAALDGVGYRNTVALGNQKFLVSSPFDDEGGVVDAGSLRTLSGVTGVPLLPTLSGATANDQERTQIAAPAHGGFFVVGFALWDNGSIDSGRVRIVSE